MNKTQLDKTLQTIKNYVDAEISVLMDRIAILESYHSTVPCTSITLNKQNLTFTDENPQTLIATVEPDNCDESIIWGVQPTGIVTVNDGVITPISNGDCVITVSCGSKSATCNVTVQSFVSLGDILLSKTNCQINEGGNDSFTIQLNSQPNQNQVVNISSNNSDIVVSPTSLTFTSDDYNIPKTITINALEDDDNANDTGIITVSSNGVDSKVINVTVIDNDTSILCTSITLNKQTLTFDNDSPQTLIATVEPTNTTEDIIWSVSPSGIATVVNGVVTPVSNGNCAITATCGSYSATCNVAVQLVTTDKDKTIIQVTIPSNNYTLQLLSSNLQILGDGYVDWGDNTENMITSASLPDVYALADASTSSHTYATAGTYTIKGKFIFGVAEPTTSVKECLTAVNQISNLEYTNSLENAFKACKKLTSVNLNGINATNVTSTRNMFFDCSMLQTINLGGLDTSKAINMNAMFQSCAKLVELDTANLSTNSATDLSYMFVGCLGLTSINVSNFNTAACKNMSGMFSSCNKLTSLDVSNFNTVACTNMSGMFNGCSGLTSLDVSNFDTTACTNISTMFQNCSNLTSLSISNFDTTKVNNMYGLFMGCKKLTSLNLDNFNTSACTNMNGMFQNCSVLTSLNLSNFDTTKVQYMSNMFNGCLELTSLDVSSFNTTACLEMNSMFQYCNKLTSINVSNFNTATCKKLNNMFANCSGLTSLNVDNFVTTSCIDMASMFSGCNKLTSINVSNFNTTTCTNMSNMFSGCSGLTSLNVDNFVTTACTNMSSMFQGCSNLPSLSVSNFNTAACTNMSAMFNGCNKLTSLDISNFDCNLVTNFGAFISGTSLNNLVAPQNIGTSMTVTAHGLSHDSVLSLINNLKTVSTSQKLQIGATLLGLLTESEKLIATNKGWTLE